MASIWTQPMHGWPTDGVDTETSDAQAQTESTIVGTLTTQPPSPPKSLAKALHAQYFGKHLLSLPAPYASLDASRPWLVYWSLHGFDLLGVALDPEMRNRAAETVLAFQHPEGGFGGGPAPGHEAHLLPTYASVMSLAITNLPEAWERIDRRGMYEFFMRCKRDDGSFVVCRGGEVDVRGIYCLLVCATMLDILTPELVAGTDKFLQACQTYEGGFASASWPHDDSAASSSPAAEAHGGYTSCALFSHYLLRPLHTGEPGIAPIDTDALLRWAVMQQGSAMEGGGFRGRTNKLVDGCYGWWLGGLFAVLEALVRDEQVGKEVGVGGAGAGAGSGAGQGAGEEEWEDVQGRDMLYNRIALQEYILIVAQGPKGGLVDKPGKAADLYHSANNLSGLSSAQHFVTHSRAQIRANRDAWKDSAPPSWLVERLQAQGETMEEMQKRRRQVWAHACGWVEDPDALHVVGGEENRVNTTNPVFNILMLRVKPFVNHFYGQ